MRAGFFLALVCLTFVAVDSWRSYSERKTRLADTAVAMANLSRTLSQHADDTITAADTALIGLVERIQIDGASPSALERIRRLMARQTTELESLHGLFIYDENGDWLVNSIRPVEPGAYNNADREYFQFHRQNADTGLHLGPPIQSRLSGDWVMPISRRINKIDGSFGGVALATLNLDYFRIFYSSIDIGEEGAIVFALKDGTILLRRPFNDELIGKNLSWTPLFQRLSKENQGSAMIKAPVDGIKRLYAYRHLERYPLVIAAAMSEREVLAEWRRNAWAHLVSVLLVVLVFTVVGMRLIGQIKLRSAAEKELLRAQQELQEMNRTLETLALVDGLTGLANRRRFDATLEDEYRRALRTGQALALILIDVDHFKQFNDRYGHPAGDECLRLVGRHVTQHCGRSGDLAARYGGEEMAVILSGCGTQSAAMVAGKIRTGIEALAIEHAGSSFGVVTVSAGVAAFEPVLGDRTPLQLIEAADRALYLAKSEGRNQVRDAS